MSASENSSLKASLNPKKAYLTAKTRDSMFEKRLITATIILLTLNIIDAELTLWGIRLSFIEEGNPLMRFVMEHNPNYLRIIKLLLPIILGAACWQTRDKSPKLIVYGMGLIIMVYSCVMLIHAHWIYNFILS